MDGGNEWPRTQWYKFSYGLIMGLKDWPTEWSQDSGISCILTLKEEPLNNKIIFNKLI